MEYRFQFNQQQDDSENGLHPGKCRDCIMAYHGCKYMRNATGIEVEVEVIGFFTCIIKSTKNTLEIFKSSFLTYNLDFCHTIPAG